MKIRLSFKTPDVTDQLNEEELEAAQTVLKKFIKWSENIQVEFDTETNTAKVLEQ